METHGGKAQTRRRGLKRKEIAASHIGGGLSVCGAVLMRGEAKVINDCKCGSEVNEALLQRCFQKRRCPSVHGFS